MRDEKDEIILTLWERLTIWGEKDEKYIETIAEYIQKMTGKSINDSRIAGKMLFSKIKDIIKTKMKCAEVYRKIKELNPGFNWKDDSTFTKDSNVSEEKRKSYFLEKYFVSILIPSYKFDEEDFNYYFDDIMSSKWMIYNNHLIFKD